jgi:hypothetical protein
MTGAHMDSSSVTAEISKVTKEILDELSSKALGKIKLERIRLKRRELLDKLQHFKEDLAKKVTQAKAKVDQDYMSRGFYNSSLHTGDVKEIEIQAVTETRTADQEYQRALDELKLVEDEVKLEISSGRRKRVIAVLAVIVALATAFINPFFTYLTKKSERAANDAATSAARSAEKATSVVADVFSYSRTGDTYPRADKIVGTGEDKDTVLYRHHVKFHPKFAGEPVVVVAMAGAMISGKERFDVRSMNIADDGFDIDLRVWGEPLPDIVKVSWIATKK